MAALAAEPAKPAIAGAGVKSELAPASGGDVLHPPGLDEMGLDALKKLYTDVFGKSARGKRANQPDWLRQRIQSQMSI